jgi:MFS family permease
VVRAAALTPEPIAIALRLYLARGWRTDLPRLVLLLQAGNAVSFFGYGLILPFEIIYLRQIRGFATATAGLVLAAILGTAALVTPPSGTLLHHFRPKPILIAGNLTSARPRSWPASQPCSRSASASTPSSSAHSSSTSLPRISLGRYISLYSLMGTGGLALGPAIGGAVLATSPDTVWWGGALVAAVIGAGFLLSGDRIPSRWPWKQ